MLDLINQNPGLTSIITIVIGLATLGGVQWRVLHILFISPRDEELRRLQRRIEEISQEQQTRSSRSANGNRDSSTDAGVFVENIRPSEGELAQGDFKTLDSFKRLIDKPDVTELQRQALIRETIGTQVIWSGKVFALDEAYDGVLTLTIEAGEGVGDLVFCRFASECREQLSPIRKNHEVTVRGKIADVGPSVSLDECVLVYSEAD